MDVKETHNLDVMEEYRAVRGNYHRVVDALVDHEHMLTLQRINNLHEQQKEDLVELRKCVQYILEHTHVIQNALRNAEDSEAAVPMCNNIVRDILAVKSNIIDSINNAKAIKNIMGVNYDPVMDNVLQKMEDQLKSWTNVLNIASRSLINSRALVDNIQNLVVAQQQMCSEVATSNIFSALDENDENKLAMEVKGNESMLTVQDDENKANNATDNQLNLSFICSTPNPNHNSEESM